MNNAGTVSHTELHAHCVGCILYNNEHGLEWNTKELAFASYMSIDTTPLSFTFLQYRPKQDSRTGTSHF